MIYIIFFFCFIASMLWLVCFGLLIAKSGTPKDIMSAFGKAVFLKTKTENTSVQITIARLAVFSLVTSLIGFAVLTYLFFNGYA